MASETDVCNSGLLLIGEKRISDITESTNVGIICNQFYANTRDGVLRSHPWNFANKLVQLGELSPVPISKWDHRFGLPGDHLKSRMINESGIERLTSTRKWEVIGKEIHTNATEVFLQYTFRVIDVNAFDSLFLEALETLLSSKFAVAIKNDNTMATRQYELFLDKLREARHADAIEGDHDIQVELDLIDSRRAFGQDILFRPFGSF